MFRTLAIVTKPKCSVTKRDSVRMLFSYKLQASWMLNLRKSTFFPGMILVVYHLQKISGVYSSGSLIITGLLTLFLVHKVHLIKIIRQFNIPDCVSPVVNFQQSEIL